MAIPLGPVLQVERPPETSQIKQKASWRPIVLLNRAAPDFGEPFKGHNDSITQSSCSTVMQFPMPNAEVSLFDDSDFTLKSSSSTSVITNGVRGPSLTQRMRACPGNSSSAARAWAVAQGASPHGGRPHSSSFGAAAHRAITSQLSAHSSSTGSLRLVNEEAMDGGVRAANRKGPLPHSVLNLQGAQSPDHWQIKQSRSQRLNTAYHNRMKALVEL
eukprot:TRINITY_DN65683_c0_g1_i1.p1 TRINITY_DN65683_c0_g1~~TRINITY_DN65683_c0_g1_i1.p1  ORF type:complete len:216 (+),score=20.16 TRINITY_DN65683_c0_g1_i1:70-717(+)